MLHKPGNECLRCHVNAVELDKVAFHWSCPMQLLALLASSYACSLHISQCCCLHCAEHQPECRHGADFWQANVLIQLHVCAGTLPVGQQIWCLARGLCQSAGDSQAAGHQGGGHCLPCRQRCHQSSSLLRRHCCCPPGMQPLCCLCNASAVTVLLLHQRELRLNGYRSNGCVPAAATPFLARRCGCLCRPLADWPRTASCAQLDLLHLCVRLYIVRDRLTCLSAAVAGF